MQVKNHKSKFVKIMQRKLLAYELQAIVTLKFRQHACGVVRICLPCIWHLSELGQT